jgi:ElaA protein
VIRIAVSTDIATCQALRHQVFTLEQGVSPEDEIDGQDGAAIHLLASRDGRPVGTARLLLKPPAGKIGRVCVLLEARGTGLGAALIRAALDRLRAEPGLATATLGAQTHATGFYAALGFRPVGEVFLDAGIPHVEMVRDL